MRQLSDDLSQMSAGTFGMQYVHLSAAYSMAMLDELNKAPELPKLEPGCVRAIVDDASMSTTLHLNGGPAFQPPDSHYFTPTALLDGGGTAHASQGCRDVPVQSQGEHFYIPADNHIQGVGPSLLSEHTLEAFGFKFENSGLNKYIVTPVGAKLRLHHWRNLKVIDLRLGDPKLAGDPPSVDQHLFARFCADNRQQRANAEINGGHVDDLESFKARTASGRPNLTTGAAHIFNA